MRDERYDKQFLSLAVERLMLSPDEVEKCLLQGRMSGESASRVALVLGMLTEEEVGLLDARMEKNQAPPLVRDDRVAERDEGVINGVYKVLARISEGGMGRVYLVEDLGAKDEQSASGSLHELLVLKTLKKGMFSAEYEQMFRREFQVLTGMRHANLEKVYDYGVVREGPADERGALFFSAEHLDGKDFLEATRGLALDKVLELVVQLCRALQFIHSRGLIHYDVKPQNVLVTGEGAAGGEIAPARTVKLIDFGIAGERWSKGPRPLKGTVPYMAPEVIRGDMVDHRADLYSLGIMLYELLAGQLPFRGNKTTDILRAHLEETVPSLMTHRTNIPAELSQLIQRLMAKNPAGRPSSANDVIRWISRISERSFELETAATLTGYVSSGAFVGRGDEMQWLQGLWEKTQRCEKAPRLALISGESGIGKTRLVREFVIWAQMWRLPVFEAKAQEGAAASMTAAREILWKIARHVEIDEHVGEVEKGLLEGYSEYMRSLLPEMGEQRETAPIAGLGPTQETTRLLDKVSEFVLKAAKAHGMILVMEDIHAADDVSIGLMEFVARKAGLGVEGGRVLLVATRLGSEGGGRLEAALKGLTGDGHVERKVLAPLTKKDQEEFIRSMFGEGPSADEILTKILKVESSGNPFFLEQVLRRWVEEGVLVWRTWGWEVDGERWKDVGLPDGAEKVIERRLARLDGDSRVILDVLAAWGNPVLGHEIDGLLESCGHQVSSESRMSQLVRSGFLTCESTEVGTAYSFSNASTERLVRKDIRGDAWRRMSQALMGRLKAEIESGSGLHAEEVELLARLAWDSGDIESYRLYGRQAARRAEERHALRAALSFYERLLEVESWGVEHAEISEKAADLRVLLGEMSDAEHSYEILLARLRDLLRCSEGSEPEENYRVALARVSRKLSLRARHAGRVAEADRRIEETLAEIRAGAQASVERRVEEVRALMELAKSRGIQAGHLEEGGQFITEADSIASSLGKHADKLRGEVLQALADFAFIKGELDSSSEYLRRACEIFESEGDTDSAATALRDIGICYHGKGDLDRALELETKALTLKEEAGDRHAMAAALFSIAILYKDKGERHRALECLQKSLRIYEELGEKDGIAAALSGMGRLYRRMSQFELAAQCEQRSIAVRREAGLMDGMDSSYINLAMIYLRKGDSEKALEHAQEALALNELSKDLHTRAVILATLGHICRYKGDYGRALEWIQKCLSLEEQMGSKPGIAQALNIMAGILFCLGDLRQALTLEEEALAICEEASFIDGLAYAFGNMGDIHLARGELHEALQFHNKSLEIAQKTGEREKEAAAYLGMAEVRRENGEFSESIEMARAALEIFTKVGLARGQAAARFSLAETYAEVARRAKVMPCHRLLEQGDVPGTALAPASCDYQAVPIQKGGSSPMTEETEPGTPCPLGRAFHESGLASSISPQDAMQDAEPPEFTRVRALLAAAQCCEPTVGQAFGQDPASLSISVIALDAARKAAQQASGQAAVEVRAEALRLLGMAQRAVGHHDAAARSFEEALVIARRHGLGLLERKILRALPVGGDDAP